MNEIAQDNSNYFTTPGTYDRLLVFVRGNGAHSEDHAIVRERMRKYDRVVDAVILSRPGHMIETNEPQWPHYPERQRQSGQ